MEKSTLFLGVGLVAGVGIALVYGSQNPQQAANPAIPHATATMPRDTDDTVEDQQEQELPPNHPPINGAAGMPSVAQEQEPASLAWTAPSGWTPAPNPNAMRLATYKVPRAPSDQDDTELVVTRAGGDVAGNVARWSGQFAGTPTVKQTHETVHALNVTVVHIEGTYGGGMGPGSGAHAGWAMLAAIVETPGQSYFFKVIGPAATVRASEKPFATMIDTLKPTAQKEP